MLKAYKYRIYPNSEQRIQIAKTFGCCRFVYNQTLAYRREIYGKEKKSVSKTDCNNYCNRELKKDYEWLKEIDKFALTNAIYNMDAAYQKFFKGHAGYPKFKSKHDNHKSYTTNFTNGNIAVDFETGKIKLPKLKAVKARLHREYSGQIKSATISQVSSGKYYVSILVETEHKELTHTNHNIGIDLGIKDLCITSDGKVYENLKIIKKYEKQLVKLQRQLSHKGKRSKNYYKTKKKIALCHEKIRNIRKDYLHKVSHEIISENQVIVSLSIPLEKYGIAYSDRQQAVDTFFDSFYGITQSFSTANLTLEQYLQSNRPLVVYGEPGTAKPQMVQMLYAKGPLSNAPLIKIDCAMLMHPGWKYLMASDRSPLMGDGCTLMMSHVEALTDEQFSELFSTIMALHTQERNRLFFVASSSSSGTMHPHYARLVDMLNCLMLQMPPLRSHLQDIPRLSGLYISTLNMRNARAVIGFEPEANLCMTEYSWPGNYDQFCRVLDELVLHTTTPYISVETVRDQLKRECTFYPGAVSQTHALPVDLTLEEIEQIAVQQALQAENGNQKRAAERLGISRTTLWRMLQKETPHPYRG